jgi:D-alanine-D-alanine ligase
MKRNIALVVGGFSGEAVVSIRSAAVVDENLDTNLYDVYKIIIDHKNWYFADDNSVVVDKNDFSLTMDGRKINFDCVFIIIHGTPGEDGKLQGYFDMLGIPYTTCDSITSSLTFNKAFCNKVIKSSGNIVNIAKSLHLFSENDFPIDNIANEIGFPCFVKPNAGGSSIGMSKVYEKANLQTAISTAFKEDGQVLVEEFIKGRELTCGIFQRKDKSILALPITEVISKKDFFDYEAKYNPSLSDEITPANINSTLRDKISAISSKIYDILNCKGIVRIDYILEEATDNIYFLEVNTVPGQSEQSIVPKQIRTAGLTVQDVYTSLIELGVRS